MPRYHFTTSTGFIPYRPTNTSGDDAALYDRWIYLAAHSAIDAVFQFHESLAAVCDWVATSPWRAHCRIRLPQPQLTICLNATSRNGSRCDRRQRTAPKSGPIAIAIGIPADPVAASSRSQEGPGWCSRRALRVGLSSLPAKANCSALLLRRRLTNDYLRFTNCSRKGFSKRPCSRNQIRLRMSRDIRKGLMLYAEA